MSELSRRLKYTDEKLKELKLAQKLSTAEKRKAIKEQRNTSKRKEILVGAIVLDRVRRGIWDFNDFTKMMNEEVVRTEDRKLFDLE
ncbi:hypothetical protein [Rhizobium rhizogenes]|uniref:hypothetical protein n=1 Tax=Rhizobium rhizogenes TaxID=359 RepID=UPI0015724502|nr:hypothetical protein [Rhizobium rhizogenes]NTG64811.1 hypothetical protein [Rhizobium rhizogenes]NTH68518.1 hypothetical protein [Rhizobium rhizogenes]NTI00014.1 hypothetical protein [Rhizobium rhizogenes]NTI39146.1 hypothetical protein [Rhizobium rhizogenes]NTJ18305.1 hypothetical protein [Rhizobium rhizogenes]